LVVRGCVCAIRAPCLSPSKEITAAIASPYKYISLRLEKRRRTIRIKKSTFTTDEHEDFTQERSASISKDHVTPFTYTNGNERIVETVKKEALKELTALASDSPSGWGVPPVGVRCPE
jgi:hypothetical protein